MCAYSFAKGLTILAFLRAVRRANRVLKERRDEVQDDVPEGVTQDDTPEVARLEDDEPVEQSDREYEDEVDSIEEEDVEGREDRGNVEEAASGSKAFHRPFQQDRAEDEFFGEARREENHESSEDQGAERQLRNPRRGPQDEELHEAERNARQGDRRLLRDLRPPLHGQTQIPRSQSLDVGDRRDGNEEGYTDEGEPRNRVQRVRLRRREERVPRDREGEDPDEGCEACCDEERREGCVLRLNQDGEEHECEDEEDVNPETDGLERPVQWCRARDRDEHLGRNHGGEVRKEIRPPGSRHRGSRMSRHRRHGPTSRRDRRRFDRFFLDRLARGEEQ